MNREEAIRLLEFHCQPGPRSFVGSLNPYSGLQEGSYQEVMAALRVLAPEFREKTIDREVIFQLWFICHTSRAWGLDPDGMLQRNKLLNPQDTAILEQWIRSISWAVLNLLESGDFETDFEEPGPGQ